MDSGHPKTTDEARKALGLETFEFNRAVVGELLKSARDSLGIRLKDVEMGTGVAASHIWNIERGKKDVTVERLARLCLFYGFSPALVIEAGLTVKWEPIKAAADENAGRIAKELGWSRPSQARRDIIAEFVAALAVIMTYLLRSCRASLFVELFSMPSFELKHRFRLVSHKFEFGIPPFERMIWLQHMPVLPEKPLLQCGLLRSKDVESYEQLIASDLPGIPRPWIPKPIGTLADFKKAFDIPAQSAEEASYLNSLPRLARGPFSVPLAEK